MAKAGQQNEPTRGGRGARKPFPREGKVKTNKDARALTRARRLARRAQKREQIIATDTGSKRYRALEQQAKISAKRLQRQNFAKLSPAEKERAREDGLRSWGGK